MKKTALFKKLGLSETEANIYLTVIENGPVTVSDIARISGLYRPTVYKNLPLLLEKQLISRSRAGKRTVYMSEDPARLRKLADRLAKELDRVLPELSQMHTLTKTRPVIRYVEGKEGIKQVYEDMIRSCGKSDIILSISLNINLW